MPPSCVCARGDDVPVVRLIHDLLDTIVRDG